MTALEPMSVFPLLLQVQCMLTGTMRVCRLNMQISRMLFTA